MNSNILSNLYNLYKSRTTAKIVAAEISTRQKKLKAWLECKDFVLAAKAHGGCLLTLNFNSLRHFKVIADETISITHHNNKIISDEMNKSYVSILEYAATLADSGWAVDRKVKSVLEQLRKASIHEKREVLRYAHIIPSTIAAAYIGISEHALNEWHQYTPIFGVTYAGGHCYSLEEAKMIASNRGWIPNYVAGGEFRETKVDDEKVLDEVVLVDYDFAAAFTNLTHYQLDQQMPRNRLSKRPFRLSDLEKIRVAKLSALQA